MSNTNTEEPVFFEMPDGTQVSNDMRWQMQQGQDAREEALNAIPDRGRVGVTDEERNAQLGVGEAPLQSGQDGDFEVDDLAVDGRTTDLPSAQAAEEKGFTPSEPKVQREVPDSNEAVAEVRRQQQEQMEAQVEAQKAMAEAGDDTGEGTPLHERNGKQLKAELARRNAERTANGEEPLETSGVTKKSQLLQVLQDDDAARGQSS